MSCQELLAFSVTYSAVLLTGKSVLDHLYDAMSKFGDKYQKSPQLTTHNHKENHMILAYWRVVKFIYNRFVALRKIVKSLVHHRYFQQGILLAILINTLSMGIEYHDQPAGLTSLVETSNIIFSTVFALEMVLKIFAEGPVKYVSNGFNVFDGVIVILR